MPRAASYRTFPPYFSLTTSRCQDSDRQNTPCSHEGCSSRLHTDTKPLQLDASDAGGRSATWRRGAARKVDSLGRLRGPPAISLSPPVFSVTVTGDEEEEHVTKGLGLLIIIFGLELC